MFARYVPQAPLLRSRYPFRRCLVGMRRQRPHRRKVIASTRERSVTRLRDRGYWRDGELRVNPKTGRSWGHRRTKGTLSLPVGWRVAIHSDTFPKICRTLPADVNYCLSNPKTPCQSPKQRRSSARTARRNTNSSASKRMRLCLTSNLAVASAGDRFTVEKARSSSNTFWWIVPGVKRNALAHHDYSPSNINIGI